MHSKFLVILMERFYWLFVLLFLMKVKTMSQKYGGFVRCSLPGVFMESDFFQNEKEPKKAILRYHFIPVYKLSN